MKLLKHKISHKTWAIILAVTLVLEGILIMVLKANTTCTITGELCQTLGVVYKP